MRGKGYEAVVLVGCPLVIITVRRHGEAVGAPAAVDGEGAVNGELVAIRQGIGRPKHAVERFRLCHVPAQRLVEACRPMKCLLKIGHFCHVPIQLLVEALRVEEHRTHLCHLGRVPLEPLVELLRPEEHGRHAHYLGRVPFEPLVELRGFLAQWAHVKSLKSVQYRAAGRTWWDLGLFERRCAHVEHVFHRRHLGHVPCVEIRVERIFGLQARAAGR